MADVITGDTQLSSTKQDLIAALVQRELQAESKLFRTITDVSAFAVKGSKTISFPKLTSFTPINRASGAAGDAAALTASVDTLPLDQRAYVAWIIDSMDEVQTTIQAQMEFAKRAASGHGRYVDNQVISQLETVAFQSVNGGVPADITQDNILDMRRDLLKENADLNRLTLAVGFDQERVMLDIPDFVRSDAYGSSNIPNGVIGRLYGVPVVLSNLIGSQQALMYEKSACAIGWQRGPAMDKQPANEYGVGSERHAMDQLFGTKGMQLGEGSAAAGKSPLAIKLRD